MIIDSSVFIEWLLGNSIESMKLREKAVNGELTVRIPENARYEIFERISREVTDQKVLQKLISLVDKLLGYISVKISTEQIFMAGEISKKLKIDLSTATCVVLAISMGEMYVTADEEVAARLKKSGYPAIHVKDYLRYCL
ncbi:PIN domain-containing protein [Archaeoglobus neptunius]|uniref:PIN domain-containing protein n=1 Tax=Archaeoglobus neptunius TaxID=2798580 RepID=UPI0019293B58|nr:PIN domain-containing protein [Archaeoglobus neptunius]